MDGGQHNFNKNIEYDNERTQFLENLGYKVIRFWNNDIDDNLDGVILELEKYINEKNYRYAPMLKYSNVGPKRAFISLLDSLNNLNLLNFQP